MSDISTWPREALQELQSIMVRHLSIQRLFNPNDWRWPVSLCDPSMRRKRPHTDDMMAMLDDLGIEPPSITLSGFIGRNGLRIVLS